MSNCRTLGVNMTLSIQRRLVILVIIVGVPCQSFFVERYYNLWTPNVCLTCRHQVCLVAVFPVKQKDQSSVVKWEIPSMSTIESLSKFWFNRLMREHMVNSYHFIRNMSSPLLSVAPIILSGCKPLSKPRGLLSSS